MKKQSLKIDFHCHILPEMDDGAASADISLQLMQMQAKQGIETVIATSHFYRFKETVGEFLARRDLSASILRKKVSASGFDLPEVLLGAEVCVQRELYAESDLNWLNVPNTDYILLEIPYTGYENWMAEEMYNICIRHKLKPMIAHLDRYAAAMKDSQIDALLSLEDVIIQINAEAFSMKHTARFALDLIKDGYPVVIGSDTHNIDSRPPDFSYANKYLNAKLKANGMNELLDIQREIIGK